MGGNEGRLVGREGKRPGRIDPITGRITGIIISALEKKRK